MADHDDTCPGSDPPPGPSASTPDIHVAAPSQPLPSPQEALEELRADLCPVDGDARVGRALLQSILDDVGTVIHRRIRTEDLEDRPQDPDIELVRWRYDAADWNRADKVLPPECFRQLSPTILHHDAPAHMQRSRQDLLAATTNNHVTQTLMRRYTVGELLRGVLEFPSVQRAMMDVEAEARRWRNEQAKARANSVHPHHHQIQH
ncbi:uncharacterized protein PFL1_05432 [Pseudozyma flocculosa PF-1]|nr:uncharacterized protein PFL1_05432 [Pseudozyma flocculosa PF-1]EPQ27151.1 hypothetical protein PFL1_05432 [Pseudozyma flocculosa PF-1]